jgi:hypothetical protein
LGSGGIDPIVNSHHWLITMPRSILIGREAFDIFDPTKPGPAAPTVKVYASPSHGQTGAALPFKEGS